MDIGRISGQQAMIRQKNWESPLVSPWEDMTILPQIHWF